ncbi:MAG: baseplate J/gp47 family protein [Myxococcales bacterium]|jgi:uncharacterized phage protein gp47/JayE|nr:baseplate J/gp47 family protein [Myxococcales bacterium]
MSFDRPALASLIARSQSTLSTKLGSTAARLDKTPENALTNMSAALADGVWGGLEHAVAQIFPATADEDFLALHAAQRAVPRKEGEDIDAWRYRVTLSFSAAPRGGTEDDFVTWARSVAGVDRAWTAPCWDGLGTVGVLVAPPGDYVRADAVVLLPAVQALLDSKPPTGVVKTAIAPAEFVVPVELALWPNTEAVQTDVTKALKLYLRERKPGEHLLWSHLRRVIASVQSLIDHRVRRPWSDLQVPARALPVLGELVFTSLH